MPHAPMDILELGSVLDSPGYMHIVALVKRRHGAYVEHLTTNPTERRKTELPDDYLRGYIAALAWVMTMPHTLVDRAMQQQEELIADEAEQRRADARARLGPSFPVAG
jgi:hypothetical protein